MQVEALELSHYEPLTLPAMESLADDAIDRFDLMGLLMVHRVGTKCGWASRSCWSPPLPVIGAGRSNAVDFCMDHLKAAAWFWKREKREDGWHWIEPRSDDHADLGALERINLPGLIWIKVDCKGAR